MPRAKKQKEDLGAQLAKSFERWEHLLVHGGSDPLYSDGANMNLVRTHILNYKRRIEEAVENGEIDSYPEIFHKDTPPKTDRNYMARTDEIRANAEKTLRVYKSDKDYLYLCEIVPYLTDKQAKGIYIGNLLGCIEGFEKAIETGDLVTMRRHECPERYLDSFARCAERVRGLGVDLDAVKKIPKAVEPVQMTLF